MAGSSSHIQLVRNRMGRAGKVALDILLRVMGAVILAMLVECLFHFSFSTYSPINGARAGRETNNTSETTYSKRKEVTDRKPKDITETITSSDTLHQKPSNSEIPPHSTPRSLSLDHANLKAKSQDAPISTTTSSPKRSSSTPIPKDMFYRHQYPFLEQIFKDSSAYTSSTSPPSQLPSMRSRSSNFTASPSKIPAYEPKTTKVVVSLPAEKRSKRKEPGNTLTKFWCRKRRKESQRSPREVEQVGQRGCQKLRDSILDSDRRSKGGRKGTRRKGWDILCTC